MTDLAFMADSWLVFEDVDGGKVLCTVPITLVCDLDVEKFLDLHGEDTLREMAENAGVSVAEVREKAKDWVEITHIPDGVKRLCVEMDGGEHACAEFGSGRARIHLRTSDPETHVASARECDGELIDDIWLAEEIRTSAWRDRAYVLLGLTA